MQKWIFLKLFFFFSFEDCDHLHFLGTSLVHMHINLFTKHLLDAFFIADTWVGTLWSEVRNTESDKAKKCQTYLLLSWSELPVIYLLDGGCLLIFVYILLPLTTSAWIISWCYVGLWFTLGIFSTGNLLLYWSSMWNIFHVRCTWIQNKFGYWQNPVQRAFNCKRLDLHKKMRSTKLFDHILNETLLFLMVFSLVQSFKLY